MMPSLTSGWPSFAVLLAKRIVQANASSHPPPSAKPLIAAREGFPSVSSRCKTPWPKMENSLPSTALRWASSLMSAPATRAFSPAPVRISTRTSALLELVKHDVGDVAGGVETHEIEQGQGAHRVAAAQLHRFVDVFDRGDALFERADGVEHVRHQQAVDDEACSVAGAHRRLAQPLCKCHDFLENVGVG